MVASLFEKLDTNLLQIYIFKKYLARFRDRLREIAMNGRVLGGDDLSYSPQRATWRPGVSKGVKAGNSRLP